MRYQRDRKLRTCNQSIKTTELDISLLLKRKKEEYETRILKWKAKRSCRLIKIVCSFAEIVGFANLHTARSPEAVGICRAPFYFSK
jgi:hypothetical protein